MDEKKLKVYILQIICRFCLFYVVTHTHTHTHTDRHTDGGFFYKLGPHVQNFGTTHGHKRNYKGRSAAQYYIYIEPLEYENSGNIYLGDKIIGAFFTLNSRGEKIK